jgi:hypothetical protein
MRSKPIPPLVNPVSEIVRSGLLGEDRRSKGTRQMVQFWAELVLMTNRRGVLRRKIRLQYREQARPVYDGAVFEA